MKRQQRGFTLVEISVALLALGLVLLAAVVFWQQSARQRVAVRQMEVQDQSRDAVLGFVQAHHRLPCPAADTAGAEDCALGQVGYLPWRTLGLPRPEAGQLRYGVYRQASPTAPEQDRDLAILRDRMNPLRVVTPDPRPDNDVAPNPSLPHLPQTVEVPLGATYSGSEAAPWNDASCDASDSPPCLALPVPRATSLVDVCLALNTAADTEVAPAGALAVRALGAAGSRRAMAFVIAAPGLLDADGNGSAFDGENALASQASPTFAAAQATVTDAYDDLVLAVSHAELFSTLHCGAALTAISHAHVNAGTAALVMERALYDYRDQLYVAVVLARADVAAATAGLLSAASATLDAAKELVSATADTTMSAGARSFQIGLAVAGIVAAAAGDVAAIAAEVDAALSLAEAEETWEAFAAHTTAMTDVARSVNENALKADAIGH